MSISHSEMELISRQLSQAHRAAIQAELNAAGLGEIGHPMLLSILQNVCEEDREERLFAQRELADLLHVSPAAVARSLKSLEKSGHLHREPGARDARCNHITMTEKGTAAVKGCREVFQRVSSRMLTGFSAQECEQLAQFQRRMLQNLTSPPQGAAVKEE